MLGNIFYHIFYELSIGFMNKIKFFYKVGLFVPCGGSSRSLRSLRMTEVGRKLHVRFYIITRSFRFFPSFRA